ncbi:phosphatidate cytidylyltransferase, partial [Tremellales sp. Uapishka_1]
MSKKGSSMSYASKSRFDVLNMDDDETVESEEEVIEETPQSMEQTVPSAPLSKGARKRLAKAAAKAAATTPSVAEVANGASQISEEAASSAQEQVTAAVDTVKDYVTENVQAVKDSASKATNGLLNGSKDIPQKEEVENVVEAATETVKNTADAVAVKVESVVNGTLEAMPSLQDTAKATLSSAKASVQALAPPVSHSVTPPSSSFAPELPDSLPQPRSNSLPANRKRKTPQDFAPSGPSGGSSPSSPNKMGVKFEDGVAPGEGQEGELVIKKKDRNALERTVWTFIMIFGFIGSSIQVVDDSCAHDSLALLCLGHPYMILLVMLCQTLVYKEVTALFELSNHGSPQPDAVPGEKGDRWSKTLNWYFFVVTNYFLYGESIIYYFKHIVFVDAYFLPFAKNHRFISFMLYVVGFVGFVANLQKQYLRQQFALFCWVHMSLLVIVVSSHFIINNILEGMIWFFIPASLVICNDVMAYICGKAFGRTPLIKLSPKKTVEGFVGAFICTLIFGLAWGTFFMRFPYMICPARDLGTSMWSQVQCRPNPVFVWKELQLAGPAKSIISTLLGHPAPAIPYAPFQIHLIFMATFASLVAPFGGFFASGFKRAFNIKDFGHSIPGHGGMTDRMDCQFMMGMFSYVYYSSLIRIQYVTVGTILQTVVTSLSTGEQLELFSDLKRFLEGQGVKI